MAKRSQPTVLIINAARGGAAGNTAQALAQLKRHLGEGVQCRERVLAQPPDKRSVQGDLEEADAFVFGTGIHWDSWSSELQQFLEEATECEGSSLWLGKPAAVVVTEHSTGGKGVLSRLQGVLSTFGCLIPPMSGIVLSQVAQEALQANPDASVDFWRPADLEVIAHNLVTAVAGRADWKSWPVDQHDFEKRWWRGAP